MGVKAVWLPSSQSEDAKAASKRWQCACAASLARRPPAWLTSHGTGSGRQARPGTWARGHVGTWVACAGAPWKSYALQFLENSQSFDYLIL